MGSQPKSTEMEEGKGESSSCKPYPHLLPPQKLLSENLSSFVDTDNCTFC